VPRNLPFPSFFQVLYPMSGSEYENSPKYGPVPRLEPDLSQQTSPNHPLLPRPFSIPGPLCCTFVLTLSAFPTITHIHTTPHPHEFERLVGRLAWHFSPCMSTEVSRGRELALHVVVLDVQMGAHEPHDELIWRGHEMLKVRKNV